jgi:CubicO group peptidase (beta-lactamase class C family)
MQERIWSKLGVERDAFWLVGPAAVETAGSGLITTLRDMARFGQMLLQKGQFNGKWSFNTKVHQNSGGCP